MDFVSKPVILIIIVALVIVLLITNCGAKKEGFSPMSEDLFKTPNYKPLDPRLWSSQWYYNQVQQPIPTSIKSHPEILEELSAVPPLVPVPRNLPSGQVLQVAPESPKLSGTENINQVGAPLNEVIQQEVDIVGPLQFVSPELREIMKGEQMKLAQLNSQYQRPQNTIQIQPQFEHRPEMTPEVRQAEMEQRVRNMSIIEEEKLHQMSQQIKIEMAPETQYRHAEMIPEYHHQESDVESLVHELANAEQATERKQEIIEQELMPGMEQKARLEQELSEKLGQKVVIQVKTDNNNLALAIFLSVLLVGFIYKTREDY